MAITLHSFTKWATRFAGAMSVLWLVSGRSWGNQSLIIVELFAIALWAENEYRLYKKKRDS